MAHTINALKRARQSARRETLNRARKSLVRTHTRRVLSAVEAKDAAKAKAELALAYKAIDKAVQRRVLHANAGARRKSSLAAAVAALK